MIEIKHLSVADAAASARWDAFVLACPQASFCHRAGWGRAVGRVFGHPLFMLYAERSGAIEGVLPLAQVKSALFGHAVVSLPFAVYGGVAASNPEAARALEAEAERITQRLGAAHLELRHVERQHDDWPVQNLYVNFRKPILPTAEAEMQAIPIKRRQKVRKGIKNGLKSAVDAGVDRFYPLYADNVHRHGTPAMPQRWFQALRDEFGADSEVLTVESAEGKPLASALVFFFRGEVVDYYAGDCEAARDLAANDFKYWEMMRRARERGLTSLDFGRSKAGTGPYVYKTGWGIAPTPLNYEFRLYKRDAVPQNNPNNPKYKLLIDTWRRMPIGLATWLGPFIVRSLG